MSMYAPPSWMQNLPYDAGNDRSIITALWPDDGVIAGLAVGPRAAGTDMSVDVAAGGCVVRGDDMPAQGSYLCQLAGPVNVAVGPAPGAGLARIDLIVAKIVDAAVTGGTVSDWSVQVVPGVPAAAPAAPPVPLSAAELAAVTVPAGTAAITASAITDRRVMLAQLGRPKQLRMKTFNPGILTNPGDWHAQGTTVFQANTDPVPGGYVLSWEFTMFAFMLTGTGGWAELSVDVAGVRIANQLTVLTTGLPGASLFVSGSMEVPDGAARAVTARYGKAVGLGGDAEVGYGQGVENNFLHVHQAYLAE